MVITKIDRKRVERENRQVARRYIGRYSLVLEPWELFCRRVERSVDYTKQDETGIQFIANADGEVVSCIVWKPATY